MADKRVSELTAKTVIELTDELIINDNSAVPIETKKCTVAAFLVSLGIRTGQTFNVQLTTDAPHAFVFDNAMGSNVEGIDYDLIVKCTDQPNSTEDIGFEITHRTQTGFTITPISAAWCEWTVIMK